MTKEELILFIKENLSIEVNPHNNRRSFDEKYADHRMNQRFRHEIVLRLEGEEISSLLLPDYTIEEDVW